MSEIIQCGRHTLDLKHPRVMGILNITPDSFSDGNQYLGRDEAIRRALDMVEEGADIIDIGGESTRPGAQAVPLSQELDRVLPVIETLAARVDVPLSVDTFKPEVMTEAARLGVGLINDVRALQEEGAIAAAVETGLPVCLMHMQGLPRTMQDDPQYDDVVTDVMGFLQSRMNACLDAGLAHEQILIDPGFGFGKTLDHNLQLLSRLSEFAALGVPVLAGLSRKRMIGSLLGDVPVEDRVFGSVSAAVIAALNGASILRVHDVRPTADALAVVSAVLNKEE
jgi:dihydropteroate synthase